MGRYSAGGQLVIARIQVWTFSVVQSVTQGSQVNVWIKVDTRSIEVETIGFMAASSVGVWYVDFCSGCYPFAPEQVPPLDTQMPVDFCSLLVFDNSCELWRPVTNLGADVLPDTFDIPLFKTNCANAMAQN